MFGVPQDVLSQLYALFSFAADDTWRLLAALVVYALIPIPVLALLRRASLIHSYRLTSLRFAFRRIWSTQKRRPSAVGRLARRLVDDAGVKPLTAVLCWAGALAITLWWWFAALDAFDTTAVRADLDQRRPAMFGVPLTPSVRWSADSAHAVLFMFALCFVATPILLGRRFRMVHAAVRRARGRSVAPWYADVRFVLGFSAGVLVLIIGDFLLWSRVALLIAIAAEVAVSAVLIRTVRLERAVEPAWVAQLLPPSKKPAVPSARRVGLPWRSDPRAEPAPHADPSPHFDPSARPGTVAAPPQPSAPLRGRFGSSGGGPAPSPGGPVAAPSAPSGAPRRWFSRTASDRVRPASARPTPDPAGTRPDSVRPDPTRVEPGWGSKLRGAPAPVPAPAPTAAFVSQDGATTALPPHDRWASYAPPLVPLKPHDPRRIGSYTLDGRLGSGGMSVVYAGRHKRDRRDVAIKVMRDVLDDADAQARLLREMEALAQATGPYTVKIVTVGHESLGSGGIGHFLVMERLHGPNLWDFVHRNGPITDPAALSHLAVVLAAGLADFHARAVTHRDLKPANVMLTDGGPVIVDLGIAKLADVTATMPGSQGFATLGYVAPETILGRGTMAPADVWSWGCCIAWAASGQRLFPGDSWDPVTYAILNGRRNLAAMEAVRRVSPPLADLVWAATDVDPARRPFNGTALLTRLPGGTSWPSPARSLGLSPPTDPTAAVRTMLHS